MSEHAVLAPSSAPQWGNCSGSVAAQANAPNLETEDSRRGTAVHHLGAIVLTNIKLGGSPHMPYEYVGHGAPNGVVIDDEMAEGANVYVDDVFAVALQYSALHRLLVEHRVHMPQIHEQNWGTLDCALPLLEHNLIYIWDYKNGHRENRAKHNLQLIDYVAGLITELGIDGVQDQSIRIVFRIVQPFCYKADGPIDEWSCMLSDLRPYFNQLRAMAHEALTNPKLSTGAWCRDCKAVKSCSAARRANYNFIDYANEPYEMDSMSGADLATERLILKGGLAVAKARLEAIDDDLKARIADGAVDTGLALQTSRGNLDWSIPPDQAIALAGQFGTDIAKLAAKTPTQAKAAVPRDLRAQFAQVLATVTRRESGGLKLVEAGDTIGARAFKP